MWPVIVRRGIIPRRIIGRRRVIGLPVIAAIIQGRGPNKSPDRCGDDHCGGIENSAHHAEWPLKGERRAGRIVLSLGGREWQSGKSDAERARYSNSADTHQGSPSYLPTGRCGRPTPDETGRGPLSRRKPGPIFRLLVPPRSGPLLFAGEAFNVACRREPLFFFLGLRASGPAKLSDTRSLLRPKGAGQR
jgi:hypothetical protein